jgi:vacuolar-type H+-ATPase subunit H
VPLMRDFLSRFRPAGAPGAGPVAVPVDHHRQLEQELSRVLLLLDQPSAECTEIVAAAHRDAEQIIAAARSDADRIVAAARQQAADDVARLMHQAVTAAHAQAAGITAAGAADAGAVRELAQRRLPVLTERAVAMVRGLGRSS